jgi:DNA-binding transcriptional MerR regulator
MEQALRIGEMAARSDLTASAIRFYEAEGVLPTPERTPAGYRGYTEDDVDLFRFVSRLRALEFPLPEVREIVALRSEGTAPCVRVRSAISENLADIESRIEDLKRLQVELRSLEDRARDLPDDWPTVCVCNVIENPTTGVNA